MEASAIDTDSSITTIPTPPSPEIINDQTELTINKSNVTQNKIFPQTPSSSPPEDKEEAENLLIPQTPSSTPPEENLLVPQTPSSTPPTPGKFSPHSPIDSPPPPEIIPRSPSSTPPSELDDRGNKVNNLGISTVNKLKSALDKKQRKNRTIELYSEVLDTVKILLNFNEVNKNIKTKIEEKLKSKYEKKCNINGYVKNNSVRLINLSCGSLKGSNIEFTIVFQYKVCYPIEGTIINCKVRNVTKAGIRAEIVEQNEPTPLVIFIARDHNNNNDDYIGIKENENIDVKIIGKRFELNDSYISVIGELASKEIV